MRKVHIITLYPEYFQPLMECGVVSRAFENDLKINLIQLREYALNKYGSVDDYSYGGGPGMVMKPDVLKRALVEGVLDHYVSKDEVRVIQFSPHGKKWGAERAKTFFEDKRDIVFICGRYEGMDQRFIDLFVDESYCIGEYVLSGGELAAAVVLDSAARFLPGVLGNKESHKEESFEGEWLDHPHYTRPQVFEGVEVPPVLLSGHHAKINEERLNWSKDLTHKWGHS